MNLTKTQHITLELLKQSGLAKTFYWTGGTLLSVRYFHHRYSHDLDFFSDTSFSFADLEDFLGRLKERLGIGEISSHHISNRWEFILPKDSMRIDFVHYNHEKKRLKPLEEFEGVNVDSLEDVAANKTMAYFDRNEPKDLYDIYFLITKGNFPAEKLLDFVKRKFGVSFSEFSFWSESIKSLKLLDSLIPLIPGENQKSQLIEAVKDFYLTQGRIFLDKIL